MKYWKPWEVFKMAFCVTLGVLLAILAFMMVMSLLAAVMM